MSPPTIEEILRHHDALLGHMLAGDADPKQVVIATVAALELLETPHPATQKIYAELGRAISVLEVGPGVRALHALLEDAYRQTALSIREILLPYNLRMPTALAS